MGSEVNAPIVVRLNAKSSIDLRKVIQVVELVADADGTTPVVPIRPEEMPKDTIMVQIFLGHNLTSFIKEPTEIRRFLEAWYAFEWELMH